MASGVVGTLRINLVANAASFSADMKKARSSIKGFADDSKADLRKYQNEAAKLFKETRTDTEKYTASMERLRALHARGLDAGTFARASAQLRQEFSSQIPLIQRWSDKLRAAFTKSGSEGMPLMQSLDWSKIGATGGMAALAAAAMAAGSAIALVKTRLSEIHETGEVAEMFGAGVGSISGLQEAAWRKGVDLETLTGSLAKMQKKITGAAGGGPDKDLFQALGLNPTAMMGMDPAKQFIAIADAISRLPTPAERTATAMEIFGKAGFHLLRFINEGREGIRRLIDEADKMGLVLTEKGVKSVDDMTDAVKRMKQAWRGAATGWAEEAAPGLEKLAKVLTPSGPSAAPSTIPSGPWSRWGPRAKPQESGGGTAAVAVTPADAINTESTLLAIQTKRAEEVKTVAELTRGWWKELQNIGADPIEVRLSQMRDQLNDKLRESINLTAEQRDLLRASGEEAISETERRMVAEEALNDLYQYEDAEQAKHNKEVEAGFKMYEEARTPLDKYKRRLEEINDAMEEMRISDETARRQASMAGKELRNAIPKHAFEWSHGGAIDSAENAKAFDVAMFGSIQTKGNDQILDEAKKQTAHLTRIQSLLEQKKESGIELDAANMERL